MTLQMRGMQVSLLLHAMVMMFVWGLNGPLAHTGDPTIALDFSISSGPQAPMQEVSRETPPERSLPETPPPVQEREASLDGKVIASIADARPMQPKEAGPISNSRDNRPTDVEFGSATGPFYHHQVMPWYPTIARKMGKEGRVLLKVTIDEKGKLVNVEVLEDPGYGFAEEAVKAVKKSSYVPARKAGIPVLTTALLPIRFVLQ
jgi:periplasmic protein TonB